MHRVFPLRVSPDELEKNLHPVRYEVRFTPLKRRNLSFSDPDAARPICSRILTRGFRFSLN